MASGAVPARSADPPRSTARTRSPGYTVHGSDSPRSPDPASAKRTARNGPSARCSTSTTPSSERWTTHHGTATGTRSWAGSGGGAPDAMVPAGTMRLEMRKGFMATR